MATIGGERLGLGGQQHMVRLEIKLIGGICGRRGCNDVIRIESRVGAHHVDGVPSRGHVDLWHVEQKGRRGGGICQRKIYTHIFCFKQVIRKEGVVAP
jgi:hypothetical protein